MAYDTWKPITESPIMAVYTMLPFSLSKGRRSIRPSIAPTNAKAHIGLLCSGWTDESALEKGKAPSRASAKVILPVTVTDERPAKNRLIAISHASADPTV